MGPALLISVATVFVKQNSVLDVFWALVLCAAAWVVVYGIPDAKAKRRSANA